jgi:hypothetical protein
VLIEPGQSASLRVGKPLTNVVEVSREGNLLRMKRCVIGAGGEKYESLDIAHPPSFAIYEGPLKIATGTMPFG